MKEAFIFVIGALTLIGIMMGAVAYGANLRHDCRLAAMAKQYSAVEIQVICEAR